MFNLCCRGRFFGADPFYYKFYHYLCSMLTFSIDTFRDKFDKMPMAAVSLFLIAGIVTSHHFEIGSFVWIALLALFLGLSFWRNGIVLMAIFALGGWLYNERSYHLMPVGQQAIMMLEINDNGINYGKYSTYSADLLQYDQAACRARVRVTADSLTTLRRGDIITAISTIRPFGDPQSSYARSMRKQGYSGRVSVSEARIIEWRIKERENLNHWAVTKLQSLLPQSDGRNVAIALSLGAKIAQHSDLKQSYSYSGVSHLLAVSGLHVGMVALMLNMLLLPLLLLWRGNIIRSTIVVMLIWLYVALCGYPTSAIRAAIMFSVLQLSHLTCNKYSQENAICSAAFIMLSLKPQMLFELSFDLSFIAVMAIIFVGKPLCLTLHSRHLLIREAINTTIISTACVFATAPLISNTFGVISTLSIFLTPVVLVFAQIIIISSLLALVMPHAVAQIIFRAAEWCANIQNNIIEWAVSTHIGYADIRISDTAMVVTYIIMALLLLLSFGCNDQQEDEEDKD